MATNLSQWDSIERQPMIPGYEARFIHSETMTLALVNAKAGSPLSEHHHPHEQITQLISGDFKLTVGGVLHHMKPGDVVTIPSNTPHSAYAISDCVIMDTFHPRRDDYVSGNFAALSQKAS